jgi:hypothetical protein
MTVCAFEHPGIAPVRSVDCPHRISQMLIHVSRFGSGVSAVPGSGVDEELFPEDQKMGIARVSFRHRELMHRLPAGSFVVTAKHDN